MSKALKNKVKLNDVVSVKDFGAVGDGVTDNTSAFLALSSHINGKFTLDDGRPVSVYFPAGEYNYTAGLEFNAPVALYSNGDATLNYSGTGKFIRLGPTNLLNSPTAYYYEECSVKNLRFTGGASATHGIYISDSILEPRISGCTFIDIGNASFWCIFGQANNWNTLIEDCKLLTLNTPRPANFIWFKGTSENGIPDGSNSRVTVRDCFMTSYNATLMGTYVRLNAAKSRVVGGGCQWSNKGIVLDYLANAVTIDTVYGELYASGNAFITAISETSGGNIYYAQDVTVRNCYVNMHQEIPTNGFLLKVDDATCKIRGWMFEDIVLTNVGNGQNIVSLNNLSGQDKNQYRNVRTLFVPRSGATTDLPAFPPVLSNAEPWSSLDTVIGTWTPFVGGTATYTSRSGTYVRVGNQVTATFDILINQIGTGYTYLVGGLPFLAKVTCSGNVGFYNTLTTAVTTLMLRIDASTNDIIVTGLTAANVSSPGTLSVLGNSSRLVGTITYIIA